MTNEKARQLHEASMRILERTGMKFLHPDAVKVLKDHGIDVDDDGIARFTESQIMEWIGKAPATIDLYAADPAYDAIIGGDDVVNASACNQVSLKCADGARRKATLDEYLKALKLYEGNPSIKVNGGIPILPEGVPTKWGETLTLHYLTLLHTNKCMWVNTGNYAEMEAVIEITCARFGITKEELAVKPRLISIANPVSPLEFDIKMTETLFTFGKYHQPVAVTPAAMAGMTTPVTLAGTLAIANAETVAGIVLAEMNAPGTPVLYGSANTTADMRSGSIAIGAPEGALCYGYAGQMARFYGIPSRAGGTLTDAKKVDAQAGYEAMMNYYTCRLNGVNFIYHSAGVLNSYLDFSFEKMIMDFEVIDYVNRIMEDITIDEESVPEDLINELGPGGTYLTEDHTMEHCREEPFAPNISVRGSMEDPDGAFDRNIKARIEQLEAAYRLPEVSDGAVENMRQVLRNHGIDEEVIARLDAAE